MLPFASLIVVEAAPRLISFVSAPFIFSNCLNDRLLTAALILNFSMLLNWVFSRLLARTLPVLSSFELTTSTVSFGFADVPEIVTSFTSVPLSP